MEEKVHTGGLKSFEIKNNYKLEKYREKAIKEGYKRAEERKRRNRFILIIIILILVIFSVGFLIKYL